MRKPDSLAYGTEVRPPTPLLVMLAILLVSPVLVARLAIAQAIAQAGMANVIDGF